MKLTNSVIKNLIKEELVKLQEQEPAPAVCKPPKTPCYSDDPDCAEYWECQKRQYFSDPEQGPTPPTEEGWQEQLGFESSAQAAPQRKQDIEQMTRGKFSRKRFKKRDINQMRRTINQLEKTGQIDNATALQTGGYTGESAQPQGEEEKAMAAKQQAARTEHEEMVSGIPARQLKPVAQQLHDALQGPGSGNAAEILARVPEDKLAALAAAFELVMTPFEKKKWGDLKQWLSDEVSPEVKQWAAKIPTTKKAEPVVGMGAGGTLSPDDVDLLAQDLYKAMKGAGTDEKKAYASFKQLKTPEDINALHAAYDRVLKAANDTGDGDLAQWLIDDGLEDLAKKVQAARAQAKSQPADPQYDAVFQKLLADGKPKEGESLEQWKERFGPHVQAAKEEYKRVSGKSEGPPRDRAKYGKIIQGWAKNLETEDEEYEGAEMAVRESLSTQKVMQESAADSRYKIFENWNRYLKRENLS
jgi:hypothetical protein